MFSFKKEKIFYIPRSRIKRIIDSAEGCYATDRITVEGCKVGFMYREEPCQNSFADSGWRFMAGDEDDDYMNNPENLAIYQVNTICNYDSDIIPFLNSAPSTAYIRDENGEFMLDEEWEVPKE